jgi:hypothetical protein
MSGTPPAAGAGQDKKDDVIKPLEDQKALDNLNQEKLGEVVVCLKTLPSIHFLFNTKTQRYEQRVSDTMTMGRTKFAPFILDSHIKRLGDPVKPLTDDEFEIWDHRESQIGRRLFTNTYMSVWLDSKKVPGTLRCETSRISQRNTYLCLNQ